jgi:hypothetical protein
MTIYHVILFNDKANTKVGQQQHKKAVIKELFRLINDVMVGA